MYSTHSTNTLWWLFILFFIYVWMFALLYALLYVHDHISLCCCVMEWTLTSSTETSNEIWVDQWKEHFAMQLKSMFQLEWTFVCVCVSFFSQAVPLHIYVARQVAFYSYISAIRVFSLLGKSPKPVCLLYFSSFSLKALLKFLCWLIWLQSWIPWHTFT